MTTKVSTESREGGSRFRWSAALAAVVAVIVVVGVAVAAWLVARDEAPVAADGAQIEMTYTGAGTSYVGDRKIIEGTVTVTLSNETTTPMILAVFGYETGSYALAAELESLEEGSSSVPTEGWFGLFGRRPGILVDTEYPTRLEPGSHSWRMDLGPGTYIFDVGSEQLTSGLWRAAVIEVVAE